MTSVCSDIFLLSLRLDVRLDLDLTDASSIKGEAPMYLIPKEADHAPIFLCNIGHFFHCVRDVVANRIGI